MWTQQAKEIFTNLIANLLAEALTVNGMLTIAAALGGAIWFLIRWHRKQRLEGKAGVEPSYLIAAGLVIVAAGFVWQGSQTRALQDGFDRLIKPRSVTEEQIKIVVEYLLKRPPAEKIEIVFSYPDEEAQQYAAQLNTPFLRGDWKPELRAMASGLLPNGQPMQDGLTFFVEYPPSNRENSRILRVAEEALQAAKITFRGMSSWTNPQLIETKILLCVGHRPRT